MNNNSNIEEKFSIDLDAYLNGTEKEAETRDEEYNELLQFSKKLAANDFSKSSNKRTVADKTLKRIKDHKMHKFSKFRRIFVSAASFAIVFCIFSQTAFAEDLVENIIKKISLGNITVVQTDSSKSANTIPNELKGKIFNKEGKAIEVYPQDGSKIYNAAGEEIVGFANGEIVTADQSKEMTLTIKDYTELAKYLSFEAKLPSYLPENYKFDRAELYKDEKGNISKDYVDLFFVNGENGKVVYMQQRASKEETKYVTGTDGKIEDIKINGVDAVICDDKNIYWEANNVLYGISSKGAFSKNELIKIAESIKS